jgi:hypothetical protein
MVQVLVFLVLARGPFAEEVEEIFPLEALEPVNLCLLDPPLHTSKQRPANTLVCGITMNKNKAANIYTIASVLILCLTTFPYQP